MSTAEYVDAKYYQAATPRSVGERLTVIARDRIYAKFLACCRPSATDTILDVGVSDVINDAANVIERKYPHPRRITAAGIGQAGAFRAEFPDVAYAQIEANRPLPFPDRAFDIATSNAVLEHVGGRDKQLLFAREMLRVARRVFITVPNRFFPFEHHTAIPFMHYGDASFVVACAWLNKSEWADENNLVLMSKARLASLMPAGIDARIGYTGLALGPCSSNLYVFAGDVN
jgi:SAM-dependent methyltransferase